MDLAWRYISRLIFRPSVIIAFFTCIFLYHVLIPLGNSDSEFSLYEDDEISYSTPLKAHHEQGKRKEKTKKRSPKKMKEKVEKAADPPPPPINDPNEFIHGSKRYKLFERKKLNFKKAEAYCKKMDGRLATTEKLDEMRRLQLLLQKAKLVSDDLWVGKKPKEWKKHAWKEKDHPPGMDKKALGAMGAMMMGGGKQEMCPALSLSTRALAPIMCLRELPFVCEFDNVDKSKVEMMKPTTKPKVEVKANKKGGKTKNKKDKVNKQDKQKEKKSPEKVVKHKPRQKSSTTKTSTTPKPKIYDGKSTQSKRKRPMKKRDEM